MTEIKNLSNNPLMVSDGKLLAPGESRKLRNVTDRERGFEKRGWLRIIDQKPVDEKPVNKTENGGKTK